MKNLLLLCLVSTTLFSCWFDIDKFTEENCKPGRYIVTHSYRVYVCDTFDPVNRICIEPDGKVTVFGMNESGGILSSQPTTITAYKCK